MFSIAAPFGSIGNLEQAFQDKYASWIILHAENEAVHECYAVESDSNQLQFGLGVAVSTWGAKPKALLAEKHQTLLVGFDSFVAAVPLVKLASATIGHRLLRLDGVFVDMVLLRDETVCVIHELGALAITADLTKVWSISTDVISDWVIDDEQKILSLTEVGSGAVLHLSVSTGATLAP